jgi:glycosyltransferase involved in cell wall biosynthesis
MDHDGKVFRKGLAMLDYWVLITVRNGEKTIDKSLHALLTQRTKPSLICIIDDGSTDSTQQVLSKYKSLYPEVFHIIIFPDRGYDSRRIVHNWNAACDYVKSLKRNFDYLFISGDDTVFPSHYVETLIQEMERHPKLVIASGSRGIRSFQDTLLLPEGAGRLIRSNFFAMLGYRHPPYYGYESWILYKALQIGYEIKKLEDLRYEHTREFGTGHKFIEYGPTMRCLGYHPMYVIARSLKNIFAGGTGIPVKYSLRMLWDYVNAGKWTNDPYFRYYEPELRGYIRKMQKKRLLGLFRLQK